MCDEVISETEARDILARGIHRLPGKISTAKEILRILFEMETYATSLNARADIAQKAPYLDHLAELDIQFHHLTKILGERND